MNPKLVNTKNYLVPAGGLTHGVIYSGVFSLTPLNIDWRSFSVDNYPFEPQGVFIDNSEGTGPLIINIQPIDYNVTCPAGVTAQFQFPAPAGMTMSIIGNGQASLVFVDFPVLPNNGLVEIGGTPNINIASVQAGLIMPVQPMLDFNGAPYNVTNHPAQAQAYQANITGTATSAAITPTPNTNIRKLRLEISDNATLATAGNNPLTVTLNGVNIYAAHPYIPATAPSGIGAYVIDLSFDDFAFTSGASGNLVVTLGAALATGYLDINAYFA